MSRFRKIGLLAAPALALVALAGCTQNFNANVARFQQLPAPQGQSFAVVADDPRLAGGLDREPDRADAVRCRQWP